MYLLMVMCKQGLIQGHHMCLPMVMCNKINESTCSVHNKGRFATGRAAHDREEKGCVTRRREGMQPGGEGVCDQEEREHATTRRGGHRGDMNRRAVYTGGKRRPASRVGPLAPTERGDCAGEM